MSTETPGPAAPRPPEDGQAPAQRPGPDGRRPKGADREDGARAGILVGRPFGVPVFVGPTWFLVAALITWVFGNQLDDVIPDLGRVRYLVSFFFAVAFYASVFVHELAHTVAALRFQLPVRRIQLQFFGGVSEIEKEAETPGREFVLAFVGPLLSAVLAAVFYGFAQLTRPGTVPGVLLGGLMISNAIVAAFNLLPGLPLDGGRMLRAVVWKVSRRPMAGTLAAAWVGRVLAVAVLVGLPLTSRLRGLERGQFDQLTDWALAAVLAFVMWGGAGNSIRMARLRERLPQLQARALARRAHPVAADTPLSEALRQAQEAGARGLVVTAPDGRPLQIVRESAIVDTPRHRRPWVQVGGLAQDITPALRVPVSLGGEDLLDLLRAHPAGEYLVVEEDGGAVGILAASDVEAAFSAALAGRPLPEQPGAPAGTATGAPKDDDTTGAPKDDDTTGAPKDDDSTGDGPDDGPRDDPDGGAGGGGDPTVSGAPPAVG